jgi:hypothetical protein
MPRNSDARFLYDAMIDAMRLTGAAPSSLSREISKDPMLFDDLCRGRVPRPVSVLRWLERCDQYVDRHFASDEVGRRP